MEVGWGPFRGYVMLCSGATMEHPTGALCERHFKTNLFKLLKKIYFRREVKGQKIICAESVTLGPFYLIHY